MDITSLYYFSELAKDLNMTKTANRLYISQQTLSNHIQRLEDYYNTLLFDRKPTLRLTQAGEYVLAFAQDIGREESDLKCMLADINNEECGSFSIGATMVRAAQLLPNILPDFFAKYPKVKCRLVDCLSAAQERKVADGSLDLGVVWPGEYGPDIATVHLANDAVYFCAAESLMKQYYSSEELARIKNKAKRGVEVGDISRVPLSMMSNRLGSSIENQFLRNGLTPNTYFSCTSSAQTIPLCINGTTACFCTHMALADNVDIIGDTINIFPLIFGEEFLYQPLALIYYKQRYIPRYLEYFISLLCKFVECQETVRVARIVQ